MFSRRKHNFAVALEFLDVARIFSIDPHPGIPFILIVGSESHLAHGRALLSGSMEVGEKKKCKYRHSEKTLASICDHKLFPSQLYGRGGRFAYVFPSSFSGAVLPFNSDCSCRSTSPVLRSNLLTYRELMDGVPGPGYFWNWS